MIGRDNEKAEFQGLMHQFSSLKPHEVSNTKRGIYIFGKSGVGKTFFVKTVLKELNYDVVSYNSSDIRNKMIMDNICKDNASDNNVISLFTKKKKKIAIVMDDIDGMISGDKGGINALIKLIRPKKKKKLTAEELKNMTCQATTIIPIICIGNCHIDKKIKELMKVCFLMELKKVPTVVFETEISQRMPTFTPELLALLMTRMNSDFHKLDMFTKLYHSGKYTTEHAWQELLSTIPHNNLRNDDVKNILVNILNRPHRFEDHETTIHETDRTIIGMLFHENVIDVLENKSNVCKQDGLELYLNVLDNLTFSDYIDRVTFQKQIWQFNEMSSIMKTFHTHKCLHDNIDMKSMFKTTDIRFTKILTKYSTEYNNMIFLHTMCRAMNMDKKDLIHYFVHLILVKETIAEIVALVEHNDVSQLDILRLYRFIEVCLDPEEDHVEELLQIIKKKTTIRSKRSTAIDDHASSKKPKLKRETTTTTTTIKAVTHKRKKAEDEQDEDLNVLMSEYGDGTNLEIDCCAMEEEGGCEEWG